MKYKTSLLLAAVCLHSVVDVSAQAGIKYGGMGSSSGTSAEWGMRDLTITGNFNYLQSQGAGVYIHELAHPLRENVLWPGSTITVRNSSLVFLIFI